MVTLLLLLGALFFGATLLLPSYLSTASKIRDVEGEIGDANRAITQQKGEEILALLDQAAITVTVLSPQPDVVPVTELFEQIEKKLPQGVSISGFLYERSRDLKTDKSDISIGGNSATRESLNEFVHRLRDDTRFSVVDLPISDLVKDKNLTFTIKASGTF